MWRTMRASRSRTPTDAPEGPKSRLASEVAGRQLRTLEVRSGLECGPEVRVRVPTVRRIYAQIVIVACRGGDRLGDYGRRAAGAAPPARPAAARVRARRRRSRPATGRLPIKRVVLYKNGVGFFEHLGRVRGTQQVSIDFTSGQLNDVLKSLTTVDLGNGKVTGVSFNTDDPANRKLGALSLPLDEETIDARVPRRHARRARRGAGRRGPRHRPRAGRGAAEQRRGPEPDRRSANCRS